jgi:Flp pilus assembly protein TadG
MIAKRVRRFLRGKERGQSIILLALGFFFLAAFVGLTTDIALMFVRFSTLRRAVDSAAIAAANQMREDRSIASVSLSARQFIEFHGLSPVDVQVDTCQTLPLEVPESSRTAVQNQMIDELNCETDQRKLVRVTAQVDSPTVFLRLLPDFIIDDNYLLQASAISETAVLDVVIIMDVSESMLFDTSIEDWASVGYGKYYVPPKADDIFAVYGSGYADNNAFWDGHLLGESQKTVNDRLIFDDGAQPGDDPDPVYEVDSGDIPGYSAQQHPREQCRVRFWPGSTIQAVSDWPAYTDGSGNVVNMRQLYTNVGATFTGNGWGGFVPTYNFYGCCNDPFFDAEVDVDNNLIAGPSFDDTAGDNKFDDLICQPFKGARDATFEFLERIDFTRGDRVGFVTFDRSAYLVQPYKIDSVDTGTRSHMIDRADEAEFVLRTLIGVRSEPNFYVFDRGTDQPDDSDLGFTAITGFSAGIDPATGASIPIDYDDPAVPSTPQDNRNQLYPTTRSCAMDNASHPIEDHTYFDTSLYDVMYPPSPISQYIDDAENAQWKAMWNNDDFAPGFPWQPSPGNYDMPFIVRSSYEVWAGCRGTNIGAALREANNALLDPTTSRRFGAVWVIVMLGDGAAGASDPVRRNDDDGAGKDRVNPPTNPSSTAQKLDTVQPYFGPLDPALYPGSRSGFGIEGEYGAFGVCPVGSRNNPGEVIDSGTDSGGFFRFPHCSDEDPATRHGCEFRPALALNDASALRDEDYYTYAQAAIDGNDDGINGPASAADEVPWNRNAGNLYDVNIEQNCDPLYDVDDYARDWADVVALESFNGGSDALLPTIFTIGFGLDFGDPDNPGTCNAFIEDCLGEQMLRYIADAGDNNRIDNDYFQDYLDEDDPATRALHGTVIDGFGRRGPCQEDYEVIGGTYDTDGSGGIDLGEAQIMYEPLPSTVSCGNYFNAPNAQELQFVFDTIASRMFTRLAQ